MVKYLKISNNNDSKKLEIMYELIYKHAHSGNIQDISDEIKDLLIDYVEEINSESIIENIIENYKITNRNDYNLNYDHICIDHNDDELTLLIFNSKLNDSLNINNTNDNEINDKVNMIGSLLNKNISASSLLLGDIYLVNVNYNNYINLYKNNEEFLEKYSCDFYKNFKFHNLLKCFSNIFFIKIFSLTDLKAYLYNKDVIENFIKSNNEYSIEDEKFIKCINDKNIFYVKFIDPIYENHYSLMNKCNNNINNFYLVSLNDDDISFIKNKKIE